jgi:hypothetical protein
VKASEEARNPTYRNGVGASEISKILEESINKYLLNQLCTSTNLRWNG